MTTGHQSTKNEVMYPINQDNKLFYNGRPKLDPTSTQRMAQRNFEENFPISINYNDSGNAFRYWP